MSKLLDDGQGARDQAIHEGQGAGVDAGLRRRVTELCVNALFMQEMYRRTKATHPDPPSFDDEQLVFEIMAPWYEQDGALEDMVHQVLDPDGEHPKDRRERYMRMFGTKDPACTP